jgi:hypothetical protein
MVLRINSRENQDEVKTPRKTRRPKRSKVRDSGDWVLKKENLLFDSLRSYSQSAEEMEQSLTALYQRFKSQTKTFDMVLKALSLGLTYGGVRGIPGKAVRL